MTAIWLVLVVAVALALLLGVVQRRITALRDRAHAAWHLLRVQLRHRHELAKRLVEVSMRVSPADSPTRIGLMESLEAAARAGRAAHASIACARAEEVLQRALRQRLDELNAAPRGREHAVSLLRADLEAAQKQIGFAIDHHNAVVHAYNRVIGSFPGAVLAALLGFRPRTAFAAGPDERTGLTVDRPIP